MIVGLSDTMPMPGAVAPAASRGSAARLARRLVRLLRRGRGLAVRVVGSTCPPETGNACTDAIAEPALPAPPQGRAAARAPRPPSRPGAARRAGAKPGRQGARPAAATRPASPMQPGAYARQATPPCFSNRFRRAVPGVTRF
jgi:hypothetical protein